MPAEVTEFLVSRPDWIQAEDPAIAARARELVSGARLEAQAVQSIIAFVRGHLTYDLSGPRDAKSVYLAGRAYCVGFANLSLALLRSVGIPARAQYGIVGAWDGWGSPPEGGRHEWIEVYYPDVGWVSSDPQVSANYVDTAHLVGFLAQGGKPGTMIERLDYAGANTTVDAGYRYTRTAPVPTVTGMPLHAATVPAVEGAALLVSPADVEVNVHPGAPHEIIHVAIAAAGPGASGWRIESHAPWLVPVTPSGPTPGSAEIRVDGSQMPAGSEVVGTLAVLADPGLAVVLCDAAVPCGAASRTLLERAGVGAHLAGLVEDLDQGAGVDDQAHEVAEPFVVEEVPAVDCGGDVGPVAGGLEAEQEEPPPVARAVAGEQRVVERTAQAGLSHLPVDVGGEIRADHVGAGPHQRGRHQPALAGSLAVEEGGGDRGDQGEAGGVIA